MTKQEHNPPIFFAIAFVILIIGLYSKFAFKGQVAMSPRPVVRDEDKTQSEQIVRNLKKLNFNRPVSCMFSDQTSTVSARMEYTNIAVVITPRNGVVQHVVVAGDCLYRWSEDKSNTGLKKCGMGTYISMGKQFLGSGLMSSEMVEEGMREVSKTMRFDLVQALDSCKNTDGVEKNVFDLPRGVRFLDEAPPASK